MNGARARVEYDLPYDGVRIHVRASDRLLLSFNVTRRFIDTAEVDTEIVDYEPLRLEEDVARALYEALGSYFGGSVADAQALRRDYDDERKRVDRFIKYVTEAAT